MKKVLGSTLTLLAVTALASALQIQTGPPSAPSWGLGRGEPPPKREKPPEFRNLTGVVLDKSDSPLKDAIVYLKNRKTKAMRTFVSDADGAFRFPNLSRTEDYEVYAELKGGKSPVKTLSSFDTRVNVRFTLYVEIPADKEKSGEKVADKTPEKPAEKDKPKADDRVRLPDTPH